MDTAKTALEPAITRQRISGSASNRSNPAASSSINSGDSAFRDSGRSMRHSATCPSTLVSTSGLTPARGEGSSR